MTKVAILPKRDEQGEMTYRAVAGATETTDVLFTSAQKQRLEELMARWRAARDAGTTLPPEEQRELDALVDAELQASTARASALAGNVEAR